MFSTILLVSSTKSTLFATKKIGIFTFCSASIINSSPLPIGVVASITYTIKSAPDKELKANHS